MRQVKRSGLVTVAAASGVLAALSGGTAYADAGAQGAATNSPGVGSGNVAQLPVNTPVQMCGNTVNVVGTLNPAAGNSCGSGGSGSSGRGSGAHAQGGSANSPGLGSGNVTQLPINTPVQACGNSISAVGLLNPSAGNSCGGGSAPVHVHHPEHCKHHHHHTAPRPPMPETPSVPAQHSHHVRTPSKPEVRPQTVAAHKAHGELAHTGAGFGVGAAAPMGAGLLLGGVLLYRRARAMQR